MIWNKNPFSLNDDPSAMDVDVVCALLAATYWSASRSRETVARFLRHSLCFGLFHGERQVGFVRVISDFTTTSWVADMVVDSAYRGQGLGRWMMECVMSHPRLSDTQFVLQTRDAHGFYEGLGFQQRPSLMSTGISYL